MRNTKIVATLGPASGSAAVLDKLIDSGLDVARLNASHGTHEEHLQRIQLTRQLAARKGANVGILLDLQGPKIRLGKFETGSAELESGAPFTLTVEPVLGNEQRASTGYPLLARDVKPGDRILLADGAAELRVLSTNGSEIRTEVVHGGVIGDNKGINLPGVNISVPSISEKDIRDLDFGLRCGIDLVALSFVRRAFDVRELRQKLRERNAYLPIIAKIEKPEAWENLEEILLEADGVMVARGDLGVEMELERVPAIQKQIIERARRQGKFIITATQMLESMVSSALPTRAEVSDVANAIFDGTDAVMLSAETSVGKYPVEAVKMMVRIAVEVERSMRDSFGKPHLAHGPAPTGPEIVADAVVQAATAAKAGAIVVFTSSGSSARLVARYRPRMPVYAFTPSEQVARRLAPVFAVRPVLGSDPLSTDEMLMVMDRTLLERRWLKPGDAVIFVAGQPVGRPGTTNLMKLHRLGEYAGV
jgi:pyruvate kinase